MKVLLNISIVHGLLCFSVCFFGKEICDTLIWKKDFKQDRALMEILEEL